MARSSQQPATNAAPKPRRRLTAPGWVIVSALASFLFVAAVVGVIRFGVLTPAGRLIVQAQVNGLRIGRLGRLRVEGLGGDLFGDFTVGRLTITDEKGLWLDARDLSIRWHMLELFRRRLHIDTLAARTVTVIRRPTLTAKTKDNGLPVSFQVDAARGRLDLLPAFSYRRGVYDVTTHFHVERAGGAGGSATLLSVLHPGDFLKTSFNLGLGKAFAVDADASEAQGGALAGALGLPADKPFLLSGHAKGTVSQGAFTLVTQVGAATPLSGTGAWNPSGGEGHGQLHLDASTLLTDYARRLGPVATFDIAGRRAPDGFYAFTLAALTDNAAIRASGEADVGRQATGPQGVALEATLKDSNRILSWPKLGGSHLVGVVTGAASAWSMAGQGEVNNADVLGFGLARLSGPFTVKHVKGETTLDVAAKGEGGAGRGLLAAMLGARPTASAQITWLSDGRMLMRKLMVQAPGLKIDGEGQHSLFGGLSFNGTATISNLAAAHAGAHGVVRGSWSASQGSGAKPWSITLDATGESLAAGLGQLDRLLGPTPRLRARADYLDGVFTVASSTIDGYAGHLNSVGKIGSGGAINLGLGWNAEGPFTIGPLEIAGAAKGTGSLTGTLENPRADLAADFAEIDLPYLPLQTAHVALTFLQGPNDSNGQIAIAGTSPYGPARGSAVFRLISAGVDLSDIDVAGGGVTAQGALSLRSGAASSADLILALGPGAVLSQGKADGRLRITDAPGGARAVLNLEATNAALRSGGVAVKTMKLTADGPLDHLPYQVRAEGVTTGGPWNLAGNGAFSTIGADNAFTFQGGGKVRRADFHTTAPAELRFGDRGTTARLQLSIGGGAADIDWREGGGTVTGKASLSNVSLGLLDQDFVGRFDADMSLTGRGQALTGALQAKLSGAGGRDLKGAAPLDGLVNATLAANTLTIDASLGSQQGLRSTAHIILPSEASAAPFRIAINRTRPLLGTFNLNGELKPVWDLLMGSERSLSGQLTAQGELRGTLRDPRAIGTATLDNGRFTDSGTGLKLQNVTLRARLADNAIDVSQLTGTDGSGGQLNGAGRISLQREGTSSFRLDLKAFRLIDNEIAKATASGQTTIERAADGKIRLAGALTIDRADIAANPPIPSGVVPMDVVEINKPVDLQQVVEGPPERVAPVALDVSLKAPGRVFLKGRGLNVELSLDAHVTGTTTSPDLTGVARVIRGDYDFAGKRFQFDNRGVIYLGASAQSIRLDLTATRDDPALTAVIRIQGTAAKPRITLTSSPVLPTDEVLSQVLFGASASQLSAGQAAQLASALSALATGGGFDIVGGLRNFARLDRLAFGGDTTGGVTVSGGKYLTDNVYLELTGGGREGASTQVEWRVKKNLSVVSRLTRQGDTRLSVRWRKDY
jgi:translocation and assembly module TamB